MIPQVDYSQIAFLPTPPDCPVLVTAARVPTMQSSDAVQRYASGWGETPAEALNRCALEIVERAAAQLWTDEMITRGPLRCLDAPAVLPTEIMLFSDAQYATHDTQRCIQPYPEDFPEHWLPERPIDWVPATFGLSSQTAWLPAGLCFLGHSKDRAVGLTPADTSGLAAGTSIDDAAVRAFTEMIERDAVAIWWYNCIARPQFDPAEIGDPLVRDYSEWTRIRQRPLCLLDLTHDCNVPVIAAVAHDLQGRRIAMGFGAGASVADAAHHATGELAQFECNVALIEQRAIRRGEDSLTPEAVALLRWWREGRIDQCPHLSALQVRSPLIRPCPLDIETCRAICSKLGLRFLAIDMTRSSPGIPVVRVFVPGLRPMWPRFAAGRLYQVPVQLGWLDRPVAPSELNPTPMVF